MKQQNCKLLKISKTQQFQFFMTVTPKTSYFSKIVLFNRSEQANEEISILHLSERFMRRAENAIYEQDDN